MAARAVRTSWRKNVRVNEGVDKVMILGCPRSGTTFLSTMFDTLPRVESLMGTLLPPAIPSIAAQVSDENIYRSLAVSFERAIDTYLHSGRFFSRAAALQKWANARPGLPALPDAIRGKREIDLFIYKEPTLAYAPEWVLEALPDAKYILIHRDGRDVANSLVKSYNVLSDEGLRDEDDNKLFRTFGTRVDDRYAPWWVEEGREAEFMACSQYARAVWMWKFMVRRCEDELHLSGRLGSDQLLIVRYEDLMRDTRTVGFEIADFLGVESNKRFEKVLDSAHTRSIGSYRKRAAPEIEEAEHIATRELKELNYL